MRQLKNYYSGMNRMINMNKLEKIREIMKTDYEVSTVLGGNGSGVGSHPCADTITLYNDEMEVRFSTCNTTSGDGYPPLHKSRTKEFILYRKLKNKE